MRLAILADIHGNLPALEAVVADLRQQQPDRVYLAGDQINRCPWNNEVLDLIAAAGWPAIYGNHEWIVGRINTPHNRPPFTEREQFLSLWWTQETLRAEHLAAIRQLPAELRLDLDSAPPIRMLHGVPGNSFLGLFPEEDESAYSTALAGVEEPVVLTAHTHRPMARRAGRWQVFNSGSVGAPYNGDPRAQYLLLDAIEGEWQPTFRQVDYDRELLPPAFVASGLLAVAGPTAELSLRTSMTGEPWSSDFAYWLRWQPEHLQRDLVRALPIYLQQHGPGRWAFPLG
jgi:predicted phosphodiesterase